MTARVLFRSRLAEPVIQERREPGAACGIIDWAIGEMGESAEKAVPMLEEMDKKKDANEGVKAAIKDALPKITGKKKDK